MILRADHSDKSFWLATYGPYTPNPPLAGDVKVDVAIIGGGFTGLSTAYNLRCDNPAMTVAVLESEVIGYGASGRNGGFSMTLFGMEPAVTKALFGQQRMIEAHRYMERAVDYVDALVREHDLQSEYWFPGFLRVATTPAYARRIQHDLELLTSMGIGGIEWIDAERLRGEVDSQAFLGAWWEPRCGLLNPARHVRELERLAQQFGVTVYERTPVTQITRGARFTLKTPGGTVTADKIVLATNAYSHLIPELRAKQHPVFTHMVVTEPLTPAQLASIGWKNRQGVEDARNLVHYFRLTADNRLAMGGSGITLAYGRKMDCDLSPRFFADLERDVVRLFPGLAGVRFTHRWGGPVSVAAQMAPAIGCLGDARAVYSLGCQGHGVSLTHLNGRTLADLICERKTDLTDVWFVNRRVLPYPPEPLCFALSKAVLAYLEAEDWLRERRTRSEAVR
ncbi:MAG: FAD-dependent oxidoreductase [Deltaproteobacteria bacterium]|nr:FAD-dependent oxidoreductase [Deltaproteobacteria bacterium]